MQVGSWQRISPSYQAEQERLHETTDYGTMAEKYAPMVSQIINNMQISHVLDYGCGKNLGLAKNLKLKRQIKYQAYDPGVPRFAKEPMPAELVCCIDVLEHVEPEHIDDVLDELRGLTIKACVMFVDTGPAVKKLPDGRNAHILQRPLGWWMAAMMKRWTLHTVLNQTPEFLFIGTP